jgi:hypothetical protein
MGVSFGNIISLLKSESRWEVDLEVDLGTYPSMASGGSIQTSNSARSPSSLEIEIVSLAMGRRCSNLILRSGSYEGVEEMLPLMAL